MAWGILMAAEGILLGASAVPVPISADELGDSERSALHAQIILLQYCICIAIPALVTALIFLWRAIQTKDVTILNEVKAAQGSREEYLKSCEATRAVMGEVVATLRDVRADVKFCPGRREREESAAVGHG